MSNNASSYQDVPYQSTPDSDLFARGREVFGKKAGGLVVKIKRYKNGNIALARALIELASTKNNPVEYIGRVLAGAPVGDEPIVVQEARRDGIFFERLGPKRWKVATTIYDERGHEVGF